MFTRSVLALMCLPAVAMADDIRVLADVGPVHSLVARVMEGVTAPDLLLSPGTSPHDYALRPSDAAALEDADVVFWVGEGLTPWLEAAVENLADDATVVQLLSVEGLRFPETSDDHHHDHDHGHDHDGQDPHAWLDPANGKLWIAAIAETLSKADPENAVIYEANAQAALAETDLVIDRLAAQLKPVSGRGYIVFHDAYGHFQTAFDIPGLGAISLSDSVRPSVARLSELRDQVLSSEAVCVFAEPQFDASLVETLTDGTQARAGVLDPLGATLTVGPTLYPMLLENLGNSLADCLTP